MYIKSAIAALAVSMAANAASAASTISYTEGDRTQVAGTTVISSNAGYSGYQLTADDMAFAAGDSVNIYSRVSSGSDDTYGFSVGDGLFTDISLLLQPDEGTVDLVGGGTTRTGVIDDSASGTKDTVFFILEKFHATSGDSEGSIFRSITPNHIAGDALLFAGLESGSYKLSISTGGVSMVDISVMTRGADVSAVPVPAALPLLAGAIVGLGFIGRKRRAA